MTEPQEKSAHSRIGRNKATSTLKVFYLYSATLLFLFACFLLATLPPNVLIDGERTVPMRNLLQSVAAQNFGFFTRSAQLEQLDVYRVSGDTATSLLITPQSRQSNMYGLSRRQRAQGPEIATIVNSITPDRWTPCDSGGKDCILQVLHTSPLLRKNNSPIPTMCGDLVFTTEKTVKWSFRDLVPTTYHVTRTIHVTAECKAT